MFPTLYQIDSKDKKRYWKISVDGATITKEYGVVDGKPIINSKEIQVCKSKKTLHEQACFDAQSDYNKKVKEGYTSMEEFSSVPSYTSTSVSSSTTSVPSVPSVPSTLKQNFAPMLANVFDDKKKITYPVFCQPKLDGVRMLSHFKDGMANLQSRNNSSLNHIDHLNKHVLKVFQKIDKSLNVILDGEIYSQEIEFKKLAGLVNRSSVESYNKISPQEIKLIQYHVYDCCFVDDKSKQFSERYSFLENLFKELPADVKTFIKLVPNKICNNLEEIKQLNVLNVSNGFEGTMIRKQSGTYHIKTRTNDLLKYKDFFDSEFEIVDGKSGEGLYEGSLIYILKGQPVSASTSTSTSASTSTSTSASNYKLFSCTSEGTIEDKQNSYKNFTKNPSKYIGRMYTVKYQSIDSETGIPRFPVGKGLRLDL